MIKKILIALLLVFVAIQFIPSEKNIHDVDVTKSVVALYSTPESVTTILQKACNDCHTENTIYPWYSKLQPAMAFMSDHVKDGKKHLNFDQFGTYSLRKQFHKLEEIVEVIEKEEMPLTSYTLIHRDAVLNIEEKEALKNWAKANIEQMKAQYPLDSLVKK